MKIDAEVYVGVEKGVPYLHIYRKGEDPYESIRFRLHSTHNVGKVETPDISASRSSANVWRDWAYDSSKQKGDV